MTDATIIEKVKKEVFGHIKDYFFPKNCLNCRAEGTWLCESCRDSLFFIDARFCPFCGNTALLFESCANCRKTIGVRKVLSLFNYSDPLARKIIKNFKYRYLRDMAGDLEPLFLKFIFKYKMLFDVKPDSVLIPVPLYWYKERERGFNQAEEIAEIIGKILDLPVKSDLIAKKVSTKNQADIKTEERFNNLKGAYKALKPIAKNIILVDDVFTTGSTVKEIAGVLRQAGAENIQVITLARG